MKQVFFIFLSFLATGTWSQKKEFNREFLVPSKTPIYVSYFGNIAVNPGAKIGFEYTLFLKEKTKEKRKKVKTIRKTLILSPSIAFYSHKNSHQGLLISADLLWRRYTKRLYFLDISAGIGNYTRFNSGTTYEVTSAGVTEIKNAKRNYISAAFSGSIGKRLTRVKSFPCDIFLRNTNHIYTNFNSAIGNDMSFEIGFRMNLNKGFNQNVVTR